MIKQGLARKTVLLLVGRLAVPMVVGAQPAERVALIAFLTASSINPAWRPSPDGDAD